MRRSAGVFDEPHAPRRARSEILIRSRLHDLSPIFQSGGRPRRCTDVAPSEYADLREAAQKVQRLAEAQIVFAKDAGKPAPKSHARTPQARMP